MLAAVVVLSLGALIILGLGLKRVPVGAVGIVLVLGRRTNDVRQEGLTWLFPWLTELVVIYRRERQVDIPPAQYYTADRVRISFKTTLRVTVTDAVALFEQGPGTYQPFSRDGEDGQKAGGEEANIVLRGLAQNSIRETVQSMRIDSVLFGGGPAGGLRERIRGGLEQTARRWGLTVPEVWLTEVDADDKEVKQAVQSEVREQMEGKGRLAGWEAQVQKGLLFNQVAAQMVEQVKREQGRDLPLEEARNFLLGFYQNDAALEVAMRAAGGTNSLMQLFYAGQMGFPVPAQAPLGAGAGVGAGSRPPRALAAPPSVAEEGTYVLGREGDIVVESDGVSRHHARLWVAGGRLSLADLGSTNGTFVSGRRLTPQVATPVEPRDTVGLGKGEVFTFAQLAAATKTRVLAAGNANARTTA
ncbi:MAG TPA: SPFH domain-containing protein [Thermoanaerobaculia bacterium]|nr:SPFH domain-containing protein [Thermoanaerobaculia bacterium]